MVAIEDTRIRLLDAAGQVFAERGFEAATVREICSRAEANVAAVNYYFRDKEGLYVEAVKRAHCSVEEDVAPEWPVDVPPSAKLREFIEGMLRNVLDERRPEWHAQLMMRELSHPTAACKALVDSYIRPKAEVLFSIVSEFLPPDAPESDRHLCAFSVVGQCLFYRVHKPVAVLLVGEAEYQSYDIPRLADHIARFTLAALEHIAGARTTVPGKTVDGATNRSAQEKRI